MVSHLLLRLSIITLSACLIALGCIKSPPTRFYVLSALAVAETEKAGGGGIAISIRPVKLPQHLDRPQIVTRASRNALHLAEFDRWAAPLKDNFARVLAENLSILIPTDHVAVFPWTGSTPIDYEVAVAVKRFEGKLGGQCSLIARWTIFRKDGEEVLSMGNSRFSEPAGEDYDAMVSAKSRMVADLSRDIAAAIKALSQ